jgi:hypothetical protein
MSGLNIAKIELPPLTAISTAAAIKNGGAKSNNLFNIENNVASRTVERCGFM